MFDEEIKAIEDLIKVLKEAGVYETYQKEIESTLQRLKAAQQRRN